ncbi:MAG: pilin [Patescibacteria group bacterium]|nr:pilin [Patescibacteria group bacterium]
MSKKLSTLATIIIILLFLANLILAVLLFTSHASAQNTSVGACAGDTCPPEGKIRVQVPIPGLSSTCTYHDPNYIVMGDNGSPQVVARPCHSVDSLPIFVARFYKFSIGLIAILAVVMIMWGGLQWIFASGNIGKVSDAKSTISAAIAGLILALTSYVILYNINPRLINLTLPGVTDITKLENVNSTWCGDITSVNKTINGNKIVVVDNSKKTITSGTDRCGIIYSYGYFVGAGFNSLGYCSGRNGCGSGDNCVNTGQNTGTFCINLKEYCRSYTDASTQEKNSDESVRSSRCNEVTAMARASGILDYSCSKDVNALSTDKCEWERIAVCGKDRKRVSCWTAGAAGECYKGSSDKPKDYCSDSFYINGNDDNTICCQKSNGDFTTFESESGKKNYLLDCSQISTCNDYSKFDAGDWLKKNDAQYCNVCNK